MRSETQVERRSAFWLYLGRPPVLVATVAMVVLLFASAIRAQAEQPALPADALASGASSEPYANSSPLAVDYWARDNTRVESVQLHYRFQDGSWTAGEVDDVGGKSVSGSFSFTPSAEGRHFFQTVATDNQGNTESGPSGEGDTNTIYDVTAPSSSAFSPGTANSRFNVTWSASDPVPASSGTPAGMASTCLMVDYGGSGWADSGVCQGGESGAFSYPPSGSPAGTYCFKTIAFDNALNAEDGGVAVNPPDSCTAYDPTAPEALVHLPLITRNYQMLQNPDFENGWSGWEHGGTLPAAISSQVVQHGSYSARLGDPSLACEPGSTSPFPDGGLSWVQQTFAVPTSASTLRIHYKIYSQDQLGGSSFDRFEIWVSGGLVLRDGNTNDIYGCQDPVQTTPDWEVFDLDLTTYSGGSITLRLENWLWPDNWFNTWTYIDNIEFLP